MISLAKFFFYETSLAKVLWYLGWLLTSGVLARLNKRSGRARANVRRNISRDQTFIMRRFFFWISCLKWEFLKWWWFELWSVMDSFCLSHTDTAIDLHILDFPAILSGYHQNYLFSSSHPPAARLQQPPAAGAVSPLLLHSSNAALFVPPLQIPTHYLIIVFRSKAFHADSTIKLYERSN